MVKADLFVKINLNKPPSFFTPNQISTDLSVYRSVGWSDVKITSKLESFLYTSLVLTWDINWGDYEVYHIYIYIYQNNESFLYTSLVLTWGISILSNPLHTSTRAVEGCKYIYMLTGDWTNQFNFLCWWQVI